jgi:D-alanyl-D-alanine carboxypeptidase
LTTGVSSIQPARTATRRARSTIVAALVVVSAALLGDLGYQSLADSFSSARPPIAAEPRAHRPNDALHRDHRGALGVAGGVVPDGTTVFDDDIPAVANLDPDLLRVVRRAATDAAGDGVEVYVNSGWRSRAYQEQLFREAVSKYGSIEEAARWVATPGTSAHESGDAVDIGDSDTEVWLSEHGANYGLCQIYRSEPWHYELRPQAIDDGCPPMYADPTRDPRMQQ